MPLEFPAVAAPMVRPDNVVVQVALAAIVCRLYVVMTRVVGLHDGMPEMHPEIVIEEEATKYDGYVSVMLLPVASAPPAVVVNENVAAAPVLPATRSESAIVKVTLVT